MALVKISELIAAGTLTGTEAYPLVQDGNTKKANPDPPGTYVQTGVITVVDDLLTAGTDITTALNALITATPAGSTLVFGPGPWILSGEIPVTKKMAFEVANGGSAVFDVRLPIDSVEKLFNVQSDDVTFRGLTFDGANAPAGSLALRHICIYAGDNVTRYRNVTVKDCRFRNLDRRGVPELGTASLQSEYGVYFNNIDLGHVEGNEVSEVSGVGVFLNWCDTVWIKDNEVKMSTTGDCLYPIHLSRGNKNIWVEDNAIKGGYRRYGGAIDAMSTELHSTNIHFRRNVIDGCNGSDSGTAVLRFLSVDGGSVADNIVRNITNEQAVYIVVNYRDLPTAQQGPVNNHVTGNTLIAGAPNQRAIDVRNDHASGTGGTNVNVTGNICASDGTNVFAAGIRMRDIRRGKVRDNTIVYAFSAGMSDSWGLNVVGSVGTIERPVVRGNEVDCQSSASSRGIYIQGAVSKPQIRENTVVNWGQFGLRLDNTVSNPTIMDNTFDGPASTSAISTTATGATVRSGNRLDPTAASSGTFTIAVAAISVTINTAEVQTGDHIDLNVTGAAATDKPVKAIGISTGVSFIVRTVDQSVVSTTALTGTWRIVH